jgi:hypothetical protein
MRTLTETALPDTGTPPPYGNQPPDRLGASETVSGT